MARTKKKEDAGVTQGAIQDIPHEVIKAKPEAPAEKLTLLTVEQTIQLSVEKIDITLATIEQWKKDYAPLATISEDDKEGYKNLEDALRTAIKARTSGNKLREELVADSLAIQRGINGHWKTLEEKIREVEEPLRKRKTEIDKAKEIAEAKREAEKQKKLDDRIAILIAHGMKFNGSYYVIGDNISMDVTTIKIMDDDTFQSFDARVVAQDALIKAEAERIENERLEREAAAQKLKEEQEAEARRLQTEKDELARQRQELEDQKKAMQKQIAQSRRTVLHNAGFIMHPLGSMEFKLKTSENFTGGTIIEAEIIDTADGPTWDNIYNAAMANVNEIKEDNKKYLAQKAEADAAEARRKEAEEKEQERLLAEKQALETRTKLRLQSLKDRFQMIPMKASGIMGALYTRESELAGNNINIFVETIESLPENEWESLLVVTQKCLDEILAAEKADADEKLKAKQEVERREAEEREAARQLQMGDAEKIKEYAAAIRAIARPQVKDESLTQRLEYFLGELDNLQELSECLLTVEAE